MQGKTQAMRHYMNDRYGLPYGYLNGLTLSEMNHRDLWLRKQGIHDGNALTHEWIKNICDKYN